MIGPGKYDDLATILREGLKADGIVLIIIGGPLGHGSSTQVIDRKLVAPLAEALRQQADMLEKDAEEDKQNS